MFVPSLNYCHVTKPTLLFSDDNAQLICLISLDTKRIYFRTSGSSLPNSTPPSTNTPTLKKPPQQRRHFASESTMCHPPTPRSKKRQRRQSFDHIFATSSTLPSENPNIRSGHLNRTGGSIPASSPINPNRYSTYDRVSLPKNAGAGRSRRGS